MQATEWLSNDFEVILSQTKTDKLENARDVRE